MAKKIIFSLLIILSAILAAETFDINYHLDGIALMNGTELDIYRYQKGYSIAKEVNYAFRTVSQFTQFKLNYDENLIILTAKISSSSDVQLYPEVYITMDDYFDKSFRAQFNKLLLVEVQKSFDSEERAEGEGLIPEIVIDLPKIAQTRTVRRFLGNKAGRLSLNGSQKVTAEGGYNTNSNRDNEDQSSKSTDIVFRQDLNLQLRGTVGEKIHVTVNHRSSNEDIMTEPSEVNVRYEGLEDEIVKNIDAGNISLRLSGSKYITYNASSEGLFGIKSDLDIGNLSISTIMGQDKAKNDTKTYSNDAEADSSSVSSKSYVNKTHYFISEPQYLYQIFEEGEKVTVNNTIVDIPNGWVGNAIKTNNSGSWELEETSSIFLPDKTKEFFLYRDDHTSLNDEATIPGIEWDDPTVDWDDNNDMAYNFDILSEGTDYILEEESGIIHLLGAVDKKYTIAITYTSQSGRVYGDASANPVEVKILRKSNQDIIDDAHYWKMQIRNIYSMGLEGGIKAEGFELDVYNEVEIDGTYNYKISNDVNSDDYVDYPDDLIAANAAILPDGRYYNQYLRLDTNYDGKVNGDDRTINLQSGHIIFPFLEPFKAFGDTLIYLQDGNTVTSDKVKMNIQVKGEVGRSSINLGINIMPGSVVVKLGEGKEKLIEGTDYIVDYDFGDITMLSEKAKDTTKEIFIDYQFRPLFAIDTKTILGFRANMEFNDNFSLGSTFVYQSEKVQEDHPKIGNENRTVILADLDGKIEYDLPFVTRSIDWLPLLKTDEKSSITLEAETAVSLTKIYGSDKQGDKKEAYVEDMEAILESYPLGVQRGSWVPASKPFQVNNYGKAKPNWFNPGDIHAQDIYIPSSLAANEKNDIVSVLAIRMKPTGLSNPGMQNLYWSGLMKYIGSEVDFSTKKYIEFLVKVNTDPQSLEKPYVKMHVNLGDVSEDFYTEFGGLGVLNKEEENDGLFGSNEDIGLDGIADGEIGDDPSDHYNGDPETVYGEEEFPNINGTEANNNYLDTEDLDDNGILNLAEIFYEYSVELNGEKYLQSEYNGWQLYRIPIDKEEDYQIISNNPNKQPSLDKISFARIWFEVEQECKIKLVSLDVVGNKWVDDPIRDLANAEISEIELDNNLESMNIGITDNQKNPHYVPAPGTVVEKSGESSFEQSLIINYQNLQTGHNGLAKQIFTDKFNFLGYERIRFWVYGEEPEDFNGDYQDQELIIRIGANETNYYEIRKPLIIRNYVAEINNNQQPTMKYSYWDDDNNPEIDFPFSNLTFLKNESDPIIIDAGDYLYYEKDGYEYRRIGNPTLSNIREMSLGIQATEDFTGNIYFDDIRVANPYEEPGYASYAKISGNLADFASINANMEIKSENFNTSTTRKENYSYEKESKMNLAGNVNLDKFSPASWGLKIPVAITRNQSLRQSRFKSNSDILRENLGDEDKEREQTKSLIYRGTVSFSQGIIPKYKIMELLIKNSSLNAEIQKKYSTTPVSADSTFSYGGTYTYKFVSDEDDVELKLWSTVWNKLLNADHHFYYFPISITNTIHYDVVQPNKWNWETLSDSLSHWTVSTGNDTTKTMNTTTNANYKMFNDLSFVYNLQTSRDMIRESYWKDYNVGIEITRSQKLSFDYRPNYLKSLLNLDVSGFANYQDRRVREGAANDTLEVFHYNGGVDRKLDVSMTLKNSDLINSFAEWLENKMKKTDADSDSPESEKTEEETADKPEDKIKDKPEDNSDKEEVLEKKSVEEQMKEKYENGGMEKKPNGKFGEYYDDKPKDGFDKFGGDKLDDKKPNDSYGKSDEKKSTHSEKEFPDAPLIVRIVSYLGRLDNITVNYDNFYKTKFDNLEQRPEFWYQLGKEGILREEPDTLFTEDGSIFEILEKEITIKDVSNKISTSAGFQILRNLGTNWHYSWEVSQNLNNNKEIKRVTFPDLSITLTEFEKIIHLEKFLTSSRLTSAFSLHVEESGDIGFKKPDSRNQNINLSPAISWTGNFGENISSNIAYNHSQSEDTNFHYTQGFNVVVSENLNSVNGSVSYSFKAPRGLKIKFIGDRIKFKNELTASISATYEKKYQETASTENITINMDRTAFTISPSATYKFSKNIDAGLTYRYEKSLDTAPTLELTTNKFGIWVEIKF